MLFRGQRDLDEGDQDGFDDENRLETSGDKTKETMSQVYKGSREFGHDLENRVQCGRRGRIIFCEASCGEFVSNIMRCAKYP